VALNQPIDAATATELSKTFRMCGCTAIQPEAQEILASKPKLRVLILPDLNTGPQQTVKVIAGGLLVQAADNLLATPEQWQVVTEKQPTPQQLAELGFAWKVCKHVKSMRLLSPYCTTLGVGAGK
jgi:phosphoribosylaminoimidazolecarboxamide formyltransferase/IMP cyclohydrolase